MLPTIRFRTPAVAVLVAAALAVTSSPASAGVLVAGVASCERQVFSQPFLPWADPAQYTLQPGGAYEDGAAQWVLDGAAITEGNEPWFVTSQADRQSLKISSGGSATSGSICVGIEHPDLRFFANAGNPAAKLGVEVLFEDSAGNVRSAPIAVIGAGNGWTLTPQIPIVANLLPLLPGSRTAVAFRFTASGGTVQIDDVYVDPLQRW